MLEKNKDYVEFTLQYTSVDWARSKDCPEVCLKGYSYFSFPGVPIMDVVCNEFDHKVVVVSKRDFEKMQADNQHYRELVKQREENCNILLQKTGFDTVEELVNYLNSEAECDTLRDAIANLEYNVKFARDERRNLSKKLDECEKDYISERDKAEALQTENEQLKKKLHEFDPIPDYKELLEKLYSKEDVEKLEWTLNHICGGQASVNGWMVTAKLWRRNYETLSKLVGFSSTEEIQDYLTNEAECDTLQEAVSKLKDQVKYTCDEWYSANSTNNSWKAAAECNSPKELIEKREALEKENEQLKDKRTHIVYLNDPLGVIAKWEKVTGYDRPEDFLKWKANIEGIVEAWKDETGCKYPGEARILLEKWKEMTKCETPEAAATWITSYESACGRGNRLAESVEKLKEEVVSWKNVTGYSTPEDYMHARISGAFHTPFDYTSAWQKATGFVTPEQAKSRIEEFERIVRLTNKNMLSTLDSEIDEWQKFTGCNSPQEAGVKINNLCDDICKWKGNYDHILKLTGYENEKDIRVLLTFNNNKYICKTMREYINYLTRNAKFTESNWQNATGCNTPGEAETTMRNLKGRIDEMKEFAAIASNWTDRIVEG